MSTASLRLGIDLGGSKIEAALLDRTGVIAYRQRVATPQGDYDATLGAVSRLCRDLEARAGISKPLPLGIGTPGSPSPHSGLMRNCNSTALNGRSLREDLQSRCDRPVRLANDADCLTLSEAHDGAGRDSPCVFGVIVGTGVGGGIAIERHLLAGPNAISGEWGHNRLPLERVHDLPEALRTPRPCYCGRQDCIETWLSGPGLALSHEQLHGTPIELPTLASEYADTAHRHTLSLYYQLLAAALAPVINIVDPDVVVLGGGLSNIASIYRELPAPLAAQLFSDCCNTRIAAAAHGDSSGVRGAAWLWP